MRNPNIKHCEERIEIDPVEFDKLKSKLISLGFKMEGNGFNLTKQMVRINPLVHKEIVIAPKAPVPQLEKDFPCVLYFKTQEEANAFMELVKEAKPNMVEKKL